jgi:hypothetical protein
VRLAHDAGFLCAKYNLERCAGKHANISTLEAAHELGLPFSSNLLEGAASSRSLSKLQWLHTEQQCPLPRGITCAAARAGDVEMLRWLLERGCEIDAETTASAARTTNNLPVLNYLHEQGCPWHDNVCGFSGFIGDLEQLRWLHAHAGTVDSGVVANAAEGGSVHVFEWLQQQQGVEFTEYTMTSAAYNGQLQLCQWLRAQRCPWDGNATHIAASVGSYETMRWLIENGCPFGDAHVLCHEAAEGCRGEDLSILRYLYDCGIMADPATLTDVLKTCGARNMLAAAK